MKTLLPIHKKMSHLMNFQLFRTRFGFPRGRMNRGPKHSLQRLRFTLRSTNQMRSTGKAILVVELMKVPVKFAQTAK